MLRSASPNPSRLALYADGAIRLGKMRPDRTPASSGPRLVDLRQLDEYTAAIAMRLGRIRSGGNCLVETGKRVVKTHQGLEHIAAVVVRVPETRLDRQGFVVTGQSPWIRLSSSSGSIRGC